jgi:uncharacterized protein involved in type VI secretion and phage assembly
MENEQLGLASAIVVNTMDPERMARVQVALPWLEDYGRSDWAPLAEPFGARFSALPIIPEVGSEVIVGFLHNDIRRPVVLGQVVTMVGP